MSSGYDALVVDNDRREQSCCVQETLDFGDSKILATGSPSPLDCCFCCEKCDQTDLAPATVADSVGCRRRDSRGGSSNDWGWQMTEETDSHRCCYASGAGGALQILVP